MTVLAEGKMGCFERFLLLVLCFYQLWLRSAECADANASSLHNHTGPDRGLNRHDSNSSHVDNSSYSLSLNESKNTASVKPFKSVLTALYSLTPHPSFKSHIERNSSSSVVKPGGNVTSMVTVKSNVFSSRPNSSYFSPMSKSLKFSNFLKSGYIYPLKNRFPFSKANQKLQTGFWAHEKPDFLALKSNSIAHENSKPVASHVPLAGMVVVSSTAAPKAVNTNKQKNLQTTANSRTVHTHNHKELVSSSRKVDEPTPSQHYFLQSINPGTVATEKSKQVPSLPGDTEHFSTVGSRVVPISRTTGLFHPLLFGGHEIPLKKPSTQQPRTSLQPISFQTSQESLNDIIERVVSLKTGQTIPENLKTTSLSPWKVTEFISLSCNSSSRVPCGQVNVAAVDYGGIYFKSRSGSLLIKESSSVLSGRVNLGLSDVSSSLPSDGEGVVLVDNSRSLLSKENETILIAKSNMF